MSSISRGSRGDSAECNQPGAACAVRIRCVYRCAWLPNANDPAASGELLGELLPIVAEISAVLDPDELLPAIARQLRRIVDYRILDIFLPEPDGTLVPAFVEGYDTSVAARLRIRPGEGIVGAAAAQREALFVPDVAADPRYLAIVPGVRAEFAIPLIHRDRLVGVLNMEGPDPEAFNVEAPAALQVLASHLAVAIENATLYRETRWYAGLLATLYEIGKETSSILDLDQLLQRVAEVVKRVIDYEMFGILLLDEERGELVLRKAVSYGASKEKKTRIRLGEGLVGAAALSKQPVLVGDVRRDPRYLALIPETRSELVVPLIHKDRVVGVFDLESSVLDRFTDEHVKILTPLASQVAVAIDNARLYAEVRKRDARLHRELTIAREIQHGLFPRSAAPRASPGSSAHFLPARELGGDLYDFYEIEDGVLGLAVGDVAGKGVPAALYGAFASGTVRSRAFERHAPADLLRRGQPHPVPARGGGAVLHPRLRGLRLPQTATPARQLRPSLPAPFAPRPKARCDRGAARPAPGRLREPRPTTSVLRAGHRNIVVFHTDRSSSPIGRRGRYGSRAPAPAQVEEHAGEAASVLGSASSPT